MAKPDVGNISEALIAFLAAFRMNVALFEFLLDLLFFFKSTYPMVWYHGRRDSSYCSI